jgi:hypothetical protein
MAYWQNWTEMGIFYQYPPSQPRQFKACCYQFIRLACIGCVLRAVDGGKSAGENENLVSHSVRGFENEKTTMKDLRQKR